jgi:hypothetical protein
LLSGTRGDVVWNQHMFGKPTVTAIPESVSDSHPGSDLGAAVCMAGVVTHEVRVATPHLPLQVWDIDVACAVLLGAGTSAPRSGDSTGYRRAVVAGMPPTDRQNRVFNSRAEQPHRARSEAVYREEPKTAPTVLRRMRRSQHA